MRRFEAFPVVVNYNIHIRKRAWPEEVKLHEAKEYVQERELSIKTTTTSDSTIENNLWKDEIDKFETRVVTCLERIKRHTIGRMVLGSINKQTTVWIVPRSDAELKERGNHSATTGPLRYEIQTDGSYARGAGSGDTQILFHPSFGDDVLFHELVHAYRYSYKKFSPMPYYVRTDRSTNTSNSEEFFAHHMQNMYLSQGNRKLGLDYTWGGNDDKNEVYDFMLQNVDTLMLLKYFLLNDPMARLAASRLDAPFNPFRDYKMLEAKFLENNKSLRELPAFGTMLSSRPALQSARRVG